MKTPGLFFRLMKEADIDAVSSIQFECYSSDYLEAEATMLSRLKASPNTVWVAEDDNGVCAYLFAYPSLLGNISALGSIFDIPVRANSLYLHDLAAARRITGHGIGTRLVQLALESSKRAGLSFSSLVSLPAARIFWSQLGYRDFSPLSSTQRGCLSSYPEPVCCMVKTL